MGLVLELQRDALNNQIRVSDLLRKAFVVSRKLNVLDIQKWISAELNGYLGGDDTIPEYRLIYGLPKIWNPYHGWQPLNIKNTDLANDLSQRKVGQSINELDCLIRDCGSDYLQMPYPHEVTKSLMSAMNIQLQPTLLVPPNAVSGILDTVRNKILEWTLELENKGVVGESMSFTEEEKQAAATNITYQVTNHIGSMNNSQLQQDSPNANQTLNVSNDLNAILDFIKNLKGQYSSLALNQDEKSELTLDIVTIEQQVNSPKPKPVILNESLKSIRSILEGIAGSVIASNLLLQLSSLGI